MQEPKDLRESLFLKKAIEAKSTNYSSVIQPTGNVPLILLVFIFFLLLLLGSLGYFYKIEKILYIKGTTILAKKPIKLLSKFNGVINKKFFFNGNFVKSKQNIAELKIIGKDCNNSLVFCEDSINLTSNISGNIEQFYLSEGDILKEGQAYAILVPESRDLLFEFTIPVELVHKVSMNQKVEIINPHTQKTRPISGKITFISIIPINRDSVNYLTITVKPLQKVNLPVGTNVEFKLVDSNKTIFEMLK